MKSSVGPGSPVNFMGFLLKWLVSFQPDLKSGLFPLSGTFPIPPRAPSDTIGSSMEDFLHGSSLSTGSSLSSGSSPSYSCCRCLLPFPSRFQQTFLSKLQKFALLPLSVPPVTRPFINDADHYLLCSFWMGAGQGIASPMRALYSWRNKGFVYIYEYTNPFFWGIPPLL